MKILYGIQGTGNGHVARARELVPELEKHAEVDVLVSGTEANITLERKIDFQFHGLSFVFGKRGGIDYLETGRKLRPLQLVEDVMSLPTERYDAIVSDFEPVSAWAGKLRGVPTVALSHQAAFLSGATPRPDSVERFPEFVLKNFAPADSAAGFHFKRYDSFIHTPVIREEVRALNPENRGHFTVYLPAYDDQFLLEMFRNFPGTQWQIFSKHARTEYEMDGIQVRRINNRDFLASVESSAGVLCGAGFETPAEALYLGKKLLVIPMTGQYEQQCNAAALAEMGVAVLPRLGMEQAPKIAEWIAKAEIIPVSFPDNGKTVVRDLLERIERIGSGGGSSPEAVREQLCA